MASRLTRSQKLKEIDKIAKDLTLLEKEQFILSYEVREKLGVEAGKIAEQMLSNVEFDPTSAGFSRKAFFAQVQSRLDQ